MKLSYYYSKIKIILIPFIIYIFVVLTNYFLSYLLGYSSTFNILLIIIFAIPATWVILLPYSSAFIWVQRFLIYLIISIASIIMTIIVLSNFGKIYVANVDSARYMLSALIQSEAAIVAIVITLTLVAVQQASSSYSTRVIDVFKTRNPDFWILLLIYIGSIIYGLSVLINIEELDPTTNISNLGNHIFYAFAFGFFALVALIPYMWNTIDLLKPTRIIYFLSEKITKKKFEDYFSDDFDNKENPILPIIDIIISSLNKYDYDIARVGLKTIADKSVAIFEKAPHHLIEKIIIDDLERVGKLVIDRNDDRTIIEVIKSIEKIGVVLAKSNSDNPAVDSLCKFGTLMARNQIDMISSIVDSLLFIRTAYFKTKVDDNIIDFIFINIEKLLNEAIEQKLEESMNKIIFILMEEISASEFGYLRNKDIYLIESILEKYSP